MGKQLAQEMKEGTGEYIALCMRYSADKISLYTQVM
jgi:hypothetical protein